MNWLWREKPDGTRGLSYPAYLTAGVIVFVLVAWLHRRVASGITPAGFTVRRRGAEVGEVTGAAASLSDEPAPEPGPPPEAQSYRLRQGGPRHHRAEPAETGSTPPAFDPVADALREPARRASAGGNSDEGFARLPPSFAPESDGDGGGPASPHALRAALLGYRDASADTDASAAAAGDPAGRPAWLARGTLLPVCLLTTVDTSNPAAVLQFGLASDVDAHRRMRLRFGTRLLGRLAGRPMRDRLALAVDTVLFADGRQVPVAATAVEADESGANLRPGVAAAFYPPPRWVQAAPYLSEFATGFLGLLQSRARRGITIGAGGISWEGGVTEDARGPAAQAAGEALTDFTRARLRELEDRCAAYYLIPAGTACWLQLESDFAGDPSHGL